MIGMTAQQRYMLDVFGFLKIEGALSDRELADAQAAADRYITLAQQAPQVCRALPAWTCSRPAYAAGALVASDSSTTRCLGPATWLRAGPERQQTLRIWLCI
jgi:hypothetical protein